MGHPDKSKHLYVTEQLPLWRLVFVVEFVYDSRWLRRLIGRDRDPRGVPERNFLVNPDDPEPEFYDERPQRRDVCFFCQLPRNRIRDERLGHQPDPC